MSGIMYTQCVPDGSMVEGTVMSVDVLRHSCEVKTTHGSRFTNVMWVLPSGGSSRTGNHITPTVGDKVVLCFSLSYPFILGYLPVVEDISCNRVQIDSGLPVGDTGDLSPMMNSPSNRVSPGRPEDMAVGDHIWTSEGGGLMGLLRGGTVLLRASRLAQIIISKFDDLIRIVGRNYEVFTDAFIDASYNLKGRIYRFTGYAENHTKVRGDDYSYKEYKGDVALAEYAEGNGFVDSVYAGTYPAASVTISKIKVMQNGGLVYDQVLDLDGHKKSTNYNGGVSYIDQTGPQLQYRVTNGGMSTITQTGTQTVIDQNGTSTATLHGDSIVLQQGGSSIVTMTNSSITASFSGGGTMVVNGSQARLQFGSHYINVNTSGVQTG